MDRRTRSCGEQQFSIVAYNRTTGIEEEVDTVDGSVRDAEDLRSEYQLSFGATFYVSYKEIK